MQGKVNQKKQHPPHLDHKDKNIGVQQFNATKLINHNSNTVFRDITMCVNPTRLLHDM